MSWSEYLDVAYLRIRPRAEICPGCSCSAMPRSARQSRDGQWRNGRNRSHRGNKRRLWQLDGWFGGNLFSQGPQTVQYTLLGYEAGYINAFTVGSTLLFTGGGGFSTSQIVPLNFFSEWSSKLLVSANGGVSSVFDGSNVSLATLSNPATPPGLPNSLFRFMIPRAIWVSTSGLRSSSLWTMAAGAFTQRRLRRLGHQVPVYFGGP